MITAMLLAINIISAIEARDLSSNANITSISKEIKRNAINGQTNLVTYCLNTKDIKMLRRLGYKVVDSKFKCVVYGEDAQGAHSCLGGENWCTYSWGEK